MAQLVEQLIRNQQVAGSSPASSSTFTEIKTVNGKSTRYSVLCFFIAIFYGFTLRRIFEFRNCILTCFPKKQDSNRRHYFIQKYNSIENFPVRGNRNHLPRNELSAFLQRVFRRIFQPATARHFHAHDGYAFNIGPADDFSQLIRIIHSVQFRAADQRDMSLDKILVKRRIGIRRAIGGNQ